MYPVWFQSTSHWLEVKNVRGTLNCSTVPFCMRWRCWGLSLKIGPLMQISRELSVQRNSISEFSHVFSYQNGIHLTKKVGSGVARANVHLPMWRDEGEALCDMQRALSFSCPVSPQLFIAFPTNSSFIRHLYFPQASDYRPSLHITRLPFLSVTHLPYLRPALPTLPTSIIGGWGLSVAKISLIISARRGQGTRLLPQHNSCFALAFHPTLRALPPPSSHQHTRGRLLVARAISRFLKPEALEETMRHDKRDNAKRVADWCNEKECFCAKCSLPFPSSLLCYTSFDMYKFMHT